VLDFELLTEKYQKFETDAAEFGFFPRSFRETMARVRGFHLQRPRSRSYQEPGEICFVYEPPEEQRARENDYKVIICSTKRRVGFVSVDSGWVIIVDGAGKIVYSIGPFIRTSSDFFDNLLFNGRVNRWRVFYRPDRCGKLMLLGHGQALKSCLWRCAEHPKVREHNRRFDDLRKPFPAEVLEFLLERRKNRRKRREAVRADSKDPFAAFKLRMKHPWVKTQSSSEIDF